MRREDTSTGRVEGRQVQNLLSDRLFTCSDKFGRSWEMQTKSQRLHVLEL